MKLWLFYYFLALHVKESCCVVGIELNIALKSLYSYFISEN